MKKFTLLELLMVTAMVSILISLLMPELSKARKKAKGGVCQSRLSQLYTFSMKYALENNNKFVSNAHVSNVGHRRYWYQEFTTSGRTYELKQKEILACPVIYDVHVPSNIRSVGMSYSLIWSVNRPDVHPKFTDISNPAHKILYGDGFGHNISGGRKLYSESINHAGRAGGPEDYIHFDKKNVIHVDGHVEAGTRSYLTSDTSLWTRD